jgi:hypothetical protein
MSITKMRSSFSHILRPLMLLLAGVFIFGAVMIIGMPSFQGRGANATASAVVATVNGKTITRTDLDQAFKSQYQMMGSTAGSSPLQTADLQMNSLKQLLLDRLKLSAAEKEGISTGYFEINREKSKMIDAQIEQIRDMVSRGSKVKLSDTELDHVLSRNNPPTSLDQLRKELDAALTRDKVRDELMVRKLEDKVKSKVGTVSDQQFMSVFQQVMIRHILIRPNAPGPQAERRAEEVLKQLQTGHDFASVAKQWSDDPASKSKGGEVGWVSALQDRDVSGLQKGQLSGVIKSPMYQGYRIIQIEDVKTNLPKDFEAKKSEYRAQYKQMVEAQAVQAYYMKVQQTSQVDIKDPEMKGYWLASAATQAPSPAQRDKVIAQAIDALQKAQTQGADLAGPHCKLAELYVLQGNTDKAIGELNYVLNTTKSGEGADLRIMLAKLYLKKNDTKQAAAQLDLAADIGYADPMVNTELSTLFKQVGMPDRAAKEQKLLDDYTKRMQAQQGMGGVPGRPGAAAAPRPGG